MKPLDDDQHRFMRTLIDRDRDWHRLATFELNGQKVATIVRRGLAEWIRQNGNPCRAAIGIRLTEQGRNYIASHS